MRMYVLLVDAIEARRLSSAAALACRGHEVAGASGVSEALRALTQATKLPHLVLCSAGLENAGALQLVQSIGERWPGLPVAVCAGEADRRIALSCLSARALAIVKSPLDAEEIGVWLARVADHGDGTGNAERNGQVALENAALVRQLAASGRLASLGQLVASITHEIRNPLNYVLENARYVSEKLDGLEGEPPPALLAALREAAGDAASGAVRIGELIRDVGAVASPDETTNVPFELGDAVRAAVRMSSAELRGRAQVFTRLGTDTPVVGSFGRMTQVFVNLLVNAAQAIGVESGSGGRIVVVCRRNGARVFAEVSDDGPGVAPEHTERLFDAFFTTKRAGEGTGLGLFLSRDIVRRHGGELRVRSMEGRGTTFTIELPADPARAVSPGASAGDAPPTGAPGVGGVVSTVSAPPDGTVLA